MLIEGLDNMNEWMKNYGEILNNLKIKKQNDVRHLNNF